MFLVYIEDNLYLKCFVSYDLSTVSEFHVIVYNFCRVFGIR